MKRNKAFLISVLLNVILAIWSLVFFILYFDVSSKSSLGQPFQFDDPHATYKIETRENGRNFVVAAYYNYNKEDDNYPGFEGTPIAYANVVKSAVDLKPFVGKRIKFSGTLYNFLNK